MVISNTDAYLVEALSDLAEAGSTALERISIVDARCEGAHHFVLLHNHLLSIRRTATATVRLIVVFNPVCAVVFLPVQLVRDRLRCSPYATGNVKW